MVRLVGADLPACPKIISNFNSSMVRLVDEDVVHLRRNIKFQFQYGAIGRQPLDCTKCKGKQFQFQYGAIGSKFYDLAIVDPP